MDVSRGGHPLLRATRKRPEPWGLGNRENGVSLGGTMFLIGSVCTELPGGEIPRNWRCGAEIFCPEAGETLTICGHGFEAVGLGAWCELPALPWRVWSKCSRKTPALKSRAEQCPTAGHHVLKAGRFSPHCWRWGILRNPHGDTENRPCRGREDCNF